MKQMITMTSWLPLKTINENLLSPSPLSLSFSLQKKKNWTIRVFFSKKSTAKQLLSSPILNSVYSFLPLFYFTARQQNNYLVSIFFLRPESRSRQRSVVVSSPEWSTDEASQGTLLSMEQLKSFLIELSVSTDLKGWWSGPWFFSIYLFISFVAVLTESFDL